MAVTHSPLQRELQKTRKRSSGATPEDAFYKARRIWLKGQRLHLAEGLEEAALTAADGVHGAVAVRALAPRRARRGAPRARDPVHLVQRAAVVGVDVISYSHIRCDVLRLKRDISLSG